MKKGEGFTTNGLEECFFFFFFFVGMGVEESEEAKGEEVGGRGVVGFKCTLGAEQQRLYPLHILLHFLPPTLLLLLFLLLRCCFLHFHSLTPNNSQTAQEFGTVVVLCFTEIDSFFLFDFASSPLLPRIYPLSLAGRNYRVHKKQKQKQKICTINKYINRSVIKTSTLSRHSLYDWWKYIWVLLF